MDFPIQLDLSEGAEQIQLTVRAESGEFQKSVRLPFAPDDLSILTRALELSTGMSVQRTFEVAEVERLKNLDLLIRSPSVSEGMTITGVDLDLEGLRELVRAGLSEVLIEPLKAPLDKACALCRADGHPVLHIRLELWFNQVQLFQFPWELLCGDRSLDREIQISRYIRYERSLDRLTPTDHLRLLVLHSQPLDLPALDLKDRDYIRDSLPQSKFGHAFELAPPTLASITRLTDFLSQDRERSTIVHFAGHGAFGWRCEGCGHLTEMLVPRVCDCGRPFPSDRRPCGFLAFTDEQTGKAHWVSAEELRVAFTTGKVQLAVLSACKSALSRRGGDVFNGIAQCLMQSVPAVIASPFPLDDQGALEFARCFYQELGNCGTLAPALYHVRNRMLPAFPNEWYRPVLYLRAAQDDGGCLLDCETLRCRAEAVSVQTRTGPARPTPEAVFTVDFTPQEEEFHRCIKAHRGRDSTGNPNPRRGRPMVFIVPGWTDSATAHYLLERLCRNLERHLPLYDATFAVQRGTPIRQPIDLGIRGNESPAGLPSSLESRLWQSIRTELFPDEADCNCMRLFNHRQPTVLYAHIPFGILRRADPLAYLRAFCRFWDAWGDQNHLFLICLFLDYPERAAGWRWGVIERLVCGLRTSERFDRSLRRFEPTRIAAIGGRVLTRVERVPSGEISKWVLRLKSDGIIDTSVHLDLETRIADLLRSGRGGGQTERALSFKDLYEFWVAYLKQELRAV